jgi:hypothetical protein
LFIFLTLIFSTLFLEKNGHSVVFCQMYW